MTTTAYNRTLAYDLESRCEWAEAAAAWQRAIDLYPSRHRRSALASADLANLAARRDACIDATNEEDAA